MPVKKISKQIKLLLLLASVTLLINIRVHKNIVPFKESTYAEIYDTTENDGTIIKTEKIFRYIISLKSQRIGLIIS